MPEDSSVLDELLKRFRDTVQSDSQLESLRKKIQSGVGVTYKEAEDYSYRSGKILSEILQDGITEEMFDRTDDFRDIITPLLEQNYKYVSNATAIVQESLNKSANIGMKSIRIDFDEPKANGISNKFVSYESYDKGKWVLGEPVVTNSQSIVDETLRANVDFHYKSGLSPKVIRIAEPKCCDFCSRWEGKFDYPNVPEDVWRRHENCRCQVVYDPKDGRMQNVYSKEWYEKDRTAELQKRINFSEQKRLSWKYNEAGEKERQKGYSYQLHPGDVKVHTPEKYINSNEWSSRFNSISDDQGVKESIVEFSRKTVLDNSNASTESMYLIDLSNGRLIAAIDADSDKRLGYVQYTSDFVKSLQSARESGTSIIAIHNHPNGLPPSADDFMKAYQNGYEKAVVAGNNGQVYVYSNKSVKLTPEICDEIHGQISVLLEYHVDPDEAFTEIYKQYGLSYTILSEEIEP